MTCHVCETAKECMALASNDRAYRVALKGYLDHLRRDHQMDERDAKAYVQWLAPAHLAGAPLAAREREVRG